MFGKRKSRYDKMREAQGEASEPGDDAVTGDYRAGNEAAGEPDFGSKPIPTSMFGEDAVDLGTFRTLEEAKAAVENFARTGKVGVRHGSILSVTPDEFERVFGRPSPVRFPGMSPMDSDASDAIGDRVLADLEKVLGQIEAPASCDILDILDEVHKEVHRAQKKHPTPFHNGHEGYAVILEELDELWDEVKADRATQASARKEAVQVAAMAIRYILEVVNAAPR